MNFISPLTNTWQFYADYWWLFTPVFLGAAAISALLHYRTQQYLFGLKWVLLEIKPPPDVMQSPKIAENLFAALHSTYLPVKWKKRFFKGEVPKWFSLEIVSNGGDIHFYIRAQEDVKTLAEHAVFAQYPDAEIREVDDYVRQLPPRLPTPEYDLFGADLIFTKADAFPIKTYIGFEEAGGKDEFVRTDPLAPLAEVLAALEPGEHIWLQFLIRPTGANWVKAAKPVVDELGGKKVKPPANLLHTIMDLTESGVGALTGATPAEPKQEEKKNDFNLQKLTPGQKYALEQVENKIAKIGFKSNIRFIYSARTELFHRSHISSVIGMFKQLYSNNLNTFKPDGKTMTFSKGWLHHIFPSENGFFKPQLEARRKRKLFLAYVRRSFRKKVMILNTEELATLWHLPGIIVKAPGFPRVEAKKGQPPAGLPTIQ